MAGEDSRPPPPASVLPSSRPCFARWLTSVSPADHPGPFVPELKDGPVPFHQQGPGLSQRPLPHHGQRLCEWGGWVGGQVATPHPPGPKGAIFDGGAAFVTSGSSALAFFFYNYNMHQIEVRSTLKPLALTGVCWVGFLGPRTTEMHSLALPEKRSLTEIRVSAGPRSMKPLGEDPSLPPTAGSPRRGWL